MLILIAKTGQQEMNDMMHMGRKALRWQDVLMIPLFLLAATGIGVLFLSLIHI